MPQKTSASKGNYGGLFPLIVSLHLANLQPKYLTVVDYRLGTLCDARTGGSNFMPRNGICHGTCLLRRCHKLPKRFLLTTCALVVAIHIVSMVRPIAVQMMEPATEKHERDVVRIIRQKMAMGYNTTLPHDVTNAIMILDEASGEDNSSMRRQLLEIVDSMLFLHPHVTHLGPVEEFLHVEEQHVDSRRQEVTDLLSAIQLCENRLLSVFVDYANDVLMDGKSPPWCSMGRYASTWRQRMAQSVLSPWLEPAGKPQVTGGTDQYCIPPPTQQFLTLCRSHHKAIKWNVQDPWARYALPQAHRIKVVQVTKSVAKLRERGSMCREVSPGIPEDARDFTPVVSVFAISPTALKTNQLISLCIMELSNFLDVHWTDELQALTISKRRL